MNLSSNGTEELEPQSRSNFWEAASSRDTGGEMSWLCSSTPFNLLPLSSFVKTQPEDSSYRILGNRLHCLCSPSSRELSWRRTRNGANMPECPATEPIGTAIVSKMESTFSKVVCSFNYSMPCLNSSTIPISYFLVGESLQDWPLETRKFFKNRNDLMQFLLISSWIFRYLIEICQQNDFWYVPFSKFMSHKNLIFLLT